MEAKDTVMKSEEILAAIKYKDGEVGVSKFKRLAEVQAEISFKAERKEERDTWLRKTDLEKARDNFTKDIILRTRSQAFREVMEWGNEECYEHPYTSHLKGEEYNRKRHRCPECWQAQLKVWGITKERDGNRH